MKKEVIDYTIVQRKTVICKGLLHQLRLQNNLTQEQLAHKMQIHPSHVSKMEGGREPASEKYITAFANLIQVNAKDLCYALGIMPKEDQKLFVKFADDMRPLLTTLKEE